MPNMRLAGTRRGFVRLPANHQILEAGGVVVAAGQDHEMLCRLCRRAVWLADGHVRADGDFYAVRTELSRGDLSPSEPAEFSRL
jgi:hypothetical protein